MNLKKWRKLGGGGSTKIYILFVAVKYIYKAMEKSRTLWKTSKELLQNKLLFYFILVLAIGNVIQFWYISDLMSIGLFLVTGLITSLFSKNMTVIILISIIIANIFTLENVITDL